MPDVQNVFRRGGAYWWRRTLRWLDGNAQDTLRALASAFIDFSERHPQLIDLMYESELTRPVDPGLEPSYRRAFDMVVNAVRSAAPNASETISIIRAVAFWTAVFGLSRILRQQLMQPFDDRIAGSWRDVVLDAIVAAAAGDLGK